MLNFFPIMFLSPLAYALLRIVLGGMFLYLGYRHLFTYRRELQALLHRHWPRFASFAAWHLGIGEILIGGMLVVGAYTQIAALAGILLSIKMLIFRRHVIHPSIPPPLFYLLVLAISISLFITGAGALAFDLPI